MINILILRILVQRMSCSSEETLFIRKFQTCICAQTGIVGGVYLSPVRVEVTIGVGSHAQGERIRLPSLSPHAILASNALLHGIAYVRYVSLSI